MQTIIISKPERIHYYGHMFESNYLGFLWFWILPDVRQRIPVEIAMSFFLDKGKYRANAQSQGMGRLKV